MQSLAAAAIIRERDFDQWAGARPGRPAAVRFGQEGEPLLLTLHLEGHGHAEVGIVDEAVGEHEVDADDRSQHVDLADENERQGQQAGQKDGSHWSLVGPSLLRERGEVTIHTAV